MGQSTTRRGGPSGGARRGVAFSVLILLGALSGAAPATAQAISGRVLEEAREAPVAAARVSLVDRDGETAAESIADGEGRFRLTPPAAGEYVIEVTALGYEPTRSPLLALDTEGEARIELIVRPAPVGLEGFSVEVEREAELFLANFNLTPAILGERWIDRAEIEEMEMPGLVKDVIRWQNIAGVSIDEYDATTLDAPLCVRFMRRSRQCAITVLDGVVVPPESAFGIVTTEIESIAVLPPTEATTFYGTQGGGGAVVIWTRRGRD